jgi:putative FmdB family regulatory protein
MLFVPPMTPLWRKTVIRRYDFKCTECSHIEEQWVDSNDSFTTCLECGNTAQRIISNVSSHFKGWGWPDADDKWARDHEKAARK